MVLIALQEEPDLITNRCKDYNKQTSNKIREKETIFSNRKKANINAGTRLDLLHVA